jgi:hypothetical protein
MRNVRLLGLVAVVPLLTLAGSTSVSQAVNPGPQPLPALSLITHDACTGGSVPDLTATLSPLSGAQGPGPIQVGQTHHWTQAQLPLGGYSLSLSAPGYVAIGDGTTSPITVERDPGPTQLVADSSFQEDQTVAASLVPTALPTPCLLLPAVQVPELAGAVVDGASGDALSNPGPINLTSPGAANPGPSQYGNSFVFSSGSVTPGTYALSVADQGYYALGTAPDGTLTPVSVTLGPGPQQLPSGESYTEGWYVLVGLAAAQATPTITFVAPKSGPEAGGTKVTITGTGLAGTYEVMFGLTAASSFTVNTAGNKIIAYSPAAPTPGPVEIMVTTLGGTAETLFGYS